MYLYAFTLYSPSHLVIPQPLCHLNHLSGGTMAFCRCPKVNPGSSFRAHPTTHGAHALRSGPPFIGAGRIWYMRLSTWSVGYLRIPLHKMDGVHYFILFQFFLPPTKIEDYIWMVYLYLYVMIWVVHCPFVSWNSMKPAWNPPWHESTGGAHGCAEGICIHSTHCRYVAWDGNVVVLTWEVALNYCCFGLWYCI